MGISQLPLDVLSKLIVSGVSVEDALNLSFTSTRSFSLLNDPYIWKQLYMIRWGKILKDHYELDNKIDRGCYRDRCIQMLNKRSVLLRSVTTMETHQFLRKFTDSDDFLAISIDELNRLELNISMVFDLNTCAKLNTLITGQNYRIGLARLLDQGPSFESFWFNLCHFDKSFHKLAPLRVSKLKRIQDSLQEQILLRYLTIQKGCSVTQLESGTLIEFNSTVSYVKCVSRAIGVILKQLSPDVIVPAIDKSKMETFVAESFIEDFSIVRIYAGLAKGHPMLIMAILKKSLTIFFQKFIIKVSQKIQSVAPVVCKNFLQVGNYYVLVNLNEKKMRYSFQAFSFTELYRFLRTQHNYSDKLIKELILPVDMAYTHSFLMDLRVNSVSSLVDDMSTGAGFQECSSDYDFEFSRNVFKAFKLKDPGDLQYLIQSKINAFEIINLIHLPQLHVPVDSPSLLNSLKSHTSEDMCGRLILHSRSSTLGIIIGVSKLEDQIFYKTITTKKSIDNYNSNNVKKVPFDFKYLEMFDMSILGSVFNRFDSSSKRFV